MARRAFRSALGAIGAIRTVQQADARGRLVERLADLSRAAALTSSAEHALKADIARWEEVATPGARFEADAQSRQLVEVRNSSHTLEQNHAAEAEAQERTELTRLDLHDANAAREAVHQLMRRDQRANESKRAEANDRRLAEARLARMTARALRP